VRSLKPWLRSRGFATIAVVIAMSQTARWYAARLFDGSDEPWGIAALAAAFWFAPRDGWSQPLSLGRRVLLCVLLVLYGGGTGSLPPLVKALILIGALIVLLARDEFPIAWGALLILSLPIVATLQFYLGYPLRRLTSLVSVPLLRAAGFAVKATGVTLEWAGERVVIDAPCSGIRMLWTGLFLSAVLACGRRLPPRKAWRLLSCTGLIVFGANVGRASVLFWRETRGNTALTGGAHEGIGLFFFAVAAAGIFGMSARLAGRSAPPGVLPSEMPA
jgi:exosortase